MKIAIYAISKNEEKHVDRFMKSCLDADVILVADTGSTDNTVSELKTGFRYRVPVMPSTARRGQYPEVQVHNISINPWRFDTARNVALALVPADVDVCIRLDLDEVLDPGWRAALEKSWIPGVTTQLWYWFNHSPGYQFKTNNIHARHGYVWRHMDHEGLYHVTDTAVKMNAPGLSITHHQDHSKPRTAILGRLELAVKEQKCSRTLYYLGREYYYYAMHDQCISTLQEQLKQADSTLSEERMDCMTMIAESYTKKGNADQAIRWYHRAIAECPTREPMVGLGVLLYNLGQKELSLGLMQQAMQIQTRIYSMFFKTFAWDETPYMVAAKAAKELGWCDKAMEYIQAAKEINPRNNSIDGIAAEIQPCNLCV